MLFNVFKLFITTVLIVIISEIAKRSTFTGGLLAALPVVSLCAFLWIYIETGSTDRIAVMSHNIFWLVLPTVPMFLLLPELLKRNVHFYASLIICAAFTITLYALLLFSLKKFGVTVK